MSKLRELLQHPLTRGLDLDDPQTTGLRREIIQQKRFLNRLYREWYSTVCNQLPEGDGPILEIGSGAGFMKAYVPEHIASDVLELESNDVICSALDLPFAENSLRAIVLINVLHHIHDPFRFFAEAKRCVREGGKIIMIEPWVSSWSSVIYSKLHHEPFDPTSESWTLPDSGPLSGGNDALPWILFHRDREEFCDRIDWRIHWLQEVMPFRYLLSGGVALRSLAPGWMFPPLTFLENCIPGWMMKRLAMFAVIVLR